MMNWGKIVAPKRSNYLDLEENVNKCWINIDNANGILTISIMEDMHF